MKIYKDSADNKHYYMDYAIRTVEFPVQVIARSNLTGETLKLVLSSAESIDELLKDDWTLSKLLSYDEFCGIHGGDIYAEFMETGAYYERLDQETFCQAQYDMYLDQFTKKLKEIDMNDL